MSSTDVVDVILPVREPAEYFELALRSLRENDEFISRVIVIDDGSKDDAVARLADRLSWSKIELVRQNALGVVAALNKGIEVSSAKFVARMDADDICLPGRFSKQLTFLRNNSDIVAVGTQVIFIDGSGAPLSERSYYPCSPKEIRSQLLSKGCVVHHPTVLFRREEIIEAGGYRPAFEYAEDYDLWLRLSERQLVANLPDALLQYRRHSKQVSEVHSRRQSFSRDLARMYALGRQSGEEFDEPLALSAPPKLCSRVALGPAPPYTPAHLIRAHDCLQSSADDLAENMKRDDILLIAGLASDGYLGERRSVRYNLLKRCVRRFDIQKDWRSALFTRWIYLKLRFSESRWLRGYRKRSTGSP